MKILQINAVYGSKSTGLIMRDIHDMLIENGQESYVAYSAGSKMEEAGISIGTRWDHTIHAVKTRLFGTQGLGSYATTKKFLTQLDQINPDLIHMHNIHSNFLNYKLVLQYTAQKKIPVLLTLHDCWFFTGKCYHFFDNGCARWKTGCGKCPKRYEDIPSLLTDSSAKVFKLREMLYQQNDLYVVGCSNWITDLAEQSPLFTGTHISTIYNGVDTSVFRPDVFSLRNELGLDGKFVIMSMANKWFDDRNSDIRERLLCSLSDKDVLMIVGCNQQQIAQESPVNVIKIGYVQDRERLAGLYASSDVFVNLTYVDNLPTVNMEAACCGTPVITFDSGGSGELVKQGVTGYVIPVNDHKQLISCVEAVRSGKISRSTCREWACENFEKAANYQKYLQLYREIVKRR